MRGYDGTTNRSKVNGHGSDIDLYLSILFQWVQDFDIIEKGNLQENLEFLLDSDTATRELLQGLLYIWGRPNSPLCQQTTTRSVYTLRDSLEIRVEIIRHFEIRFIGALLVLGRDNTRSCCGRNIACRYHCSDFIVGNTLEGLACGKLPDGGEPAWVGEDPKIS